MHGNDFGRENAQDESVISPAAGRPGRASPRTAYRAEHSAHAAAELPMRNAGGHRTAWKQACVGEALHQLMGVFSQIRLKE